MDSEPEEQEHNIYHRLVDAAEGRVSLSSHDAEDIIHLLTKLITVKTEKSKEEVEASIYDYLEQNSLFDDGLGNDHLDETFIHYLTTTYAKVYEDALTPHDYEIIGRPTLVTGETIYNLGDLIPSEPLKEVLSYIDDWNFNPFQLPPLTPYGLAFTVETILQRLHITSELDINEIKLRRYLCSIQDGYHDIPYHNYLHGADVAQTAYYICTKSNVIDALGMNTLSILAMIIGGAIHDVGHPGVNAKFLTTNSMPLAIQYNDISPLENMHLSTAFTLWLKNENNFTDKIPRVLYKDLRKMIIDMVLATDNDMHFTLVGKLNDLLATGELNVILHGSPQTTGHRPPLMSTTSVTLNPIGSRSRSASQSSSFTKGQIINNHPRKTIGKTLTSVGSHAGYRKDAGAGPSRAHVALLLEVLYSLISGMMPDDYRSAVPRHLLTQVLLPLHSPNEMVEWRSQVPVIQAYHPILTKCILVLISKYKEYIRRGKDGMTHSIQSTAPFISSSSSSSSSSSKMSSSLLSHIQEEGNDVKVITDKCTPLPLVSSTMLPPPPIANRNVQILSGTSIESTNILTMAIHGLLSKEVWPSIHQPNHVKEVLLLQELETYLLLAQPEDIEPILDIVIDKLCDCSGRVTQHVRVIERTLLLLKKPEVLRLLFLDESHTPPSVRQLKLKQVILTLYRDGKKSWNPTVNRMTSHTLLSLQSFHPEVFKEVANSLFLDEEMIKNSDRAISVITKHDTDTNGKRPIEEKKKSGHNSDSLEGKVILAPIVLNANERLISETSPQYLPSVKSCTNKSDIHEASATDVITIRSAPRSSQSSPLLSMAPPKSHTSKSSTHMMKSPLSTISTGHAPINRVPMAIRPLPARAGASAQQVTKNLPWYATKAGASGLSSAEFSMTVTGVAPWAQQQSVTKTKPAHMTNLLVSESSDNKDVNDVKDSTEQPCQTVTNSAPEIYKSGYDRLMEYITICQEKPNDGDEDTDINDENKSWNKVLQSTSPTLLPELKFHDLVFGHELGSGAFSVVKYARHVVKEKSRHAWPEYAIKIISSHKIIEHNYMKNVEREMAILYRLTHPCISRLVSTFRYKDSAYMVLEYASGGDLHTYVIKHGSFKELAVRFIISEVVAALVSIHELGFSYMDLKPENILITATGHIKVADFGGARALSERARKEVMESRGILRKLRNGDWRDIDSNSTTATTIDITADTENNKNNMNEGKYPISKDVTTDNEKRTSNLGNVGDDVDDDDERLEGTPGYMSPEALILGSTRTRADGREVNQKADAWSLGCLTYFCYHGRPLYWGDREQVLQQIYDDHYILEDLKLEDVHTPQITLTGKRKVRFTERREDNDGDVDKDMSLKMTTDFIMALLIKDVDARMSVTECMNHTYLTHGSTETVILVPSSVHTQNPPVKLNATHDHHTDGNVASADRDDTWKRRQLSVLIAPMPSSHDYDIRTASSTQTHELYQVPGVPIYTLQSIPETSYESCSMFL